MRKGSEYGCKAHFLPLKGIRLFSDNTLPGLSPIKKCAAEAVIPLKSGWRALFYAASEI
jgi:hypothetical protein